MRCDARIKLRDEGKRLSVGRKGRKLSLSRLGDRRCKITNHNFQASVLQCLAKTMVTYLGTFTSCETMWYPIVDRPHFFGLQ